MSFLKNPSFDLGTSSWNAINLAGSVQFNVGVSPFPPPVTGSNIASMVSQVKGGSIGQDVANINARSVTCLAYVMTATPPVDLHLTIWNLSKVGGKVASSTPVTIPDAFTWHLISNMLDIDGTPNASLRVEVYLLTANSQLAIDNVNLF